MKLITLKCTSCGGNYSVDSSKGMCKCPYCGEIAVIDESDAVKLKQLEVKEAEIKAEHQTEQKKTQKEMQTGLIVAALACFIFAFVIILLFKP